MKTIVASAACFLLGLAAGWFISANATTSAPTSNVSAAEPGPVASAPKSSTQPKQTPAQTTPSFEDALLNIPVEVPSGRGEITGAVKTREGRAVSGATIIAHGIAMEAPVGRIAPTLQQEVEALVRRRRFAELTEARATTDSQGRYTLSVSAGVKYTAQGEHDRYNLYAQAQNAQAGETLDFVASPIVRVTFAVRAPDGSMPKRAHILINWPGVESEPLVLDWYADAPLLRMYPERVSIRAQDWDSPEIRSDAKEVTLQENVDPALIELEMHSIPGIKGQVVCPKLDRWPQFELACVKSADAPKSDAEWRAVAYRKGVKMTVPQDEHYSYSFLNLEPGEYIVAALLHSRVVARFTTSVENSLIVKDLVMPMPERADIVVVRAFDPEGEPLLGNQFYQNTYSERSTGGGPLESVTQPDGSIWVFGYAASDDRPVGTRFFLTVTSQRYGSQDVEYTPSASADVTVRFETPATLTLKFAPGVELDISKLQITLEQSFRTDIERRSRVSGRASGSVWSYGPLSPGEYIATISFTGNMPPERILGTQLLRVVSGNNELSLGLPPLYVITVRLPVAKAGQHVGLTLRTRNSGWSGSEPCDDQGRAVFKSIPAGIYMVSCDWEAMLYEVTTSAEIDFKPIEFNAMSVEIYDEKGAFYVAGLRRGDLIVGVNGKEFTSRRLMQSTLQLLEDGKPVKLMVSRNKTVLEFVIDEVKDFRYHSGAYTEPCPR